jgi:cell division protein FtsQ
MIVRRNRRPRAIVRRSAQTVGDRKQRLIVKRGRGGVQPPIDDRRRTSRDWHFRKRWLVVAAATLSLAVVVGAGAWLWQSPFFEVTHVKVEGNERMATDTIVEKANMLGQNMFTADLAGAQKELYGLPLVSSVNIEREWPNTLKIVVKERQAWGTWEQGGVRYTIDREGVVLGTIPPPDGSPVIRSSEQGSRLQGDRVDYQAVDAAAEIYERLPRQLGTTVTEVAFVAGKGVQVTTANGETALFGDSSSIAYKLAVWAALSQQARTKGISYTTIDLRYGNRPVLQ